jgi:hypothetical protein
VEKISDLTERECWELLAMASMGRMALSAMALPIIVPVQYYVDRKTLAICLGPHEIQPDSVDGTIVALSVDEIHEVSGSGWAVHVQGALRTPQTDVPPRDCGQPAAGQVVHLEAGTIAGYGFKLCPFTPGF